MKKAFIILIAILMAELAVVAWLDYKKARNVVTVTDTVLIRDTLIVREPVAAETVRLRTEVVRLPRAAAPADTTEYHFADVSNMLTANHLPDGRKMVDSVDVEVPITQLHYRAPDYDLWLHGFRAGLDSLKIYKTDTVIRQTTVPVSRGSKKTHRLSLGLHAGYGITPKGMQPYIGVGIGFRVW